MPTYEYRCRDCGHDLEAVQSFTDDALTECPNCAGRLRKVFGNVGIAFKGSGFYKNDSRSGSSSSTGSSNGDKSESTSGDDAKKPAEKPAEKGSSASSGSGGEKAGGDKAGGDTSTKTSSS